MTVVLYSFINLQSPIEHRYLSHYPNVLKDCKSETSKYVNKICSIRVLLLILHFLCSPCRVAFESVVRSMLSVGFEEEEIVAVVALLAGVILIGDIVS